MLNFNVTIFAMFDEEVCEWENRASLFFTYICSLSGTYSLLNCHHGYCWKLGSCKIFSLNCNDISRTAGPILGLLVFIWMHFSCWIQIRQWKCKILKFLKKFVKKSGTCSLQWIVQHSKGYLVRVFLYFSWIKQAVYSVVYR